MDDTELCFYGACSTRDMAMGARSRTIPVRPRVRDPDLDTWLHTDELFGPRPRACDGGDSANRLQCRGISVLYARHLRATIYVKAITFHPENL